MSIDELNSGAGCRQCGPANDAGEPEQANEKNCACLVWEKEV